MYGKVLITSLISVDFEGVKAVCLSTDISDERWQTTVRYFLTDHLGSTEALANASGAIVSSTSYDSFGNATANIATTYRYTGREYDEETGLYYYRNRWYDPELGRFISTDPIGFAGGDINLYGYVWNSPLNFTDCTLSRYFFISITINLGLVWTRCLVFTVSREGRSIVEFKMVKQRFTREIKLSTETIKALSEKYNLNPKRILKWKHAESALDKKSGLIHPRSTVLSVLEE